MRNCNEIAIFYYENKKSMKQFAITLLIICSIFTISCEQQRGETLVSKSSSEKLTITVNSSRYVEFDPWTVDVKVTLNGHPNNFLASREIVAEAINKDNVSFNWISETKCIIKIKQRDGEVVSIPVLISI